MKVAANSPENEDVCERCGNPEALEIGGKFLCLDCVALAGCGCAGHGDNDEA